MTLLVDTHAHLDLPDFDADRAAVLDRARQARVGAVVVIGYDPQRWRSTATITDAQPWIVRAVGLHPNSAALWSDTLLGALRAEVAMGDAVAIGETGLDFYRAHAPRDLQIAAFEAQLQIARAANLPIVIHQREAENEVLTLLERDAPWRGVMHCFSGNTDFARRCVGLGLCLGVGGVATYPKSGEVRDALASAPLDKLLLETDAPFLAPQPWRGKRNESAYVTATLETLAAGRGVDADVIARATTANAIALFGSRLAAALSAQPQGT